MPEICILIITSSPELPQVILGGGGGSGGVLIN